MQCGMEQDSSPWGTAQHTDGECSSTPPQTTGYKTKCSFSSSCPAADRKTCDLVILPLKPFFRDTAILHNSYAFLFQFSHVHLMPFMQLHASRQSRQAAALGIYIWILPVSHGALSQSLHQLLWAPQRPPVRHNQPWVGALHDVLVFMLKKSMRDSYRPLTDWWRALWGIPKFAAFCRYALA